MNVTPARHPDRDPGRDPDLDRLFGRGRVRMVTGRHVEVYREEARAGERRRYTKRFLATDAGDFREWTEREWRILARLVGHGIACVPEVARFDRGGPHEPAVVQTYDAGITVDHWATLLPVRRDGRLSRHVFEDCAHWWALARHLLLALDAIHELRLVHLDLKADNVCIPASPPDFDPAVPGQALHLRFGQLALIDFAFSLVCGDPLATALPLARQPDYDYQSPRLLAALQASRAGDLRPTRELDWRCDFYSLAALLARYLPDSDAPPEAGWTAARLHHAVELLRRLHAIHDAELPAQRPHADLADDAAALLRDPALAASLARGWLPEGRPDPTALRSPTPITRIAQPLAATPAAGAPAHRPPRHAPRRWATLGAGAAALVVAVPLLAQAWKAWSDTDEAVPHVPVAVAAAPAAPAPATVQAPPPEDTRSAPAAERPALTATTASAAVSADPAASAPTATPSASDPAAATGGAATAAAAPASAAPATAATAASAATHTAANSADATASAPAANAPRSTAAATATPPPAAARAARSATRQAAAPRREAAPPVRTAQAERRAAAPPRKGATPAPTPAQRTAAARPSAAATPTPTKAAATTDRRAWLEPRSTPRPLATASTRPPPTLPPPLAEQAVLRPLPSATSTPPVPAQPAPAAAPAPSPAPVPAPAPPTEPTRDLQARADTLLAGDLPRIAERAERMVLRVLFAAGRGDGVQADDDIRQAATQLRLAPAESMAVWSTSEARSLDDAAQQAQRRGDLAAAIGLMTRAFAANPLDADIAGDLAALRLRSSSAHAPAARQLALHALTTPHGRHPQGRLDDWTTLAIASALTGRDRDARHAWYVTLALAPSTERLCRIALNAYVRHGERLRPSIDALLQRAEASGRATGSACEWPPRWAGNNR